MILGVILNFSWYVEIMGCENGRDWDCEQFEPACKLSWMGQCVDYFKEFVVWLKLKCLKPGITDCKWKPLIWKHSILLNKMQSTYPLIDECKLYEIKNFYSDLSTVQIASFKISKCVRRQNRLISTLSNVQYSQQYPILN